MAKELLVFGVVLVALCVASYLSGFMRSRSLNDAQSKEQAPEPTTPKVQPPAPRWPPPLPGAQPRNRVNPPGREELYVLCKSVAATLEIPEREWAMSELWRDDGDEPKCGCSLKLRDMSCRIKLMPDGERWEAEVSFGHESGTCPLDFRKPETIGAFAAIVADTLIAPITVES